MLQRLEEQSDILWLQAIWHDALLAARLFAIDPHGLGLSLRAKAGPVRDRWLAYLRSCLEDRVPFRTMPASVGDERLLGGLDLAATLKAGHVVARAGLLAEANGGVILAAMAERLSPDAASRLTQALDFGEVRLERDGLSALHAARFGVVALDEGEGEDEGIPAALQDRLAFWPSLDPLSIHIAYEPDEKPALDAARAVLADIELGDDALVAMTTLSLSLGIVSLRAPMLALRAARAHAALSGRASVGEDDISAAARLVLAPRATQYPIEEADDDISEPESVEPDNQQNETRENENPQPETLATLEDVILEAIRSGLPPDILAKLKETGRSGGAKSDGGRHGGAQFADRRGRPVGSRRGELKAGKRLDVIGTLRAAAPYQKLRRAMRSEASGMKEGEAGRSRRVEVRAEDFQIMRYKERRETATIFAVDASGSTALSRLAEAKGAVELLLAEGYARRDHVALIAFRKNAAELLLAPTRSLVRAKRALAALPGGGGTPLASGIEAGFAVCDEARRRGRTPTFVLLTDGSANVALDGAHGRERAFDDAITAARRFATYGFKALVVDIARRRNPRAADIAAAMNAHYIPLPQVDAQTLSNAVRTAQSFRPSAA